MAQSVHVLAPGARDFVRELFPRPLRSIPAHVDHFVVFLKIADRHRHVIVSINNLMEVVAEVPLEKLGILLKKLQEESIKSSN